MTVREIIELARELDPSFTDQRHPGKVAVNRLSRLQRRLVAEWVKEEPEGYVEEFEIEFPLDDFAAGVAIEEGESVPVAIGMTMVHRPLDMYLKGQTQAVNLDLIAWGDRNRFRGRAAWLRNNTLFFSGSERDWRDVTSVTLTYTPTPSDIASLDEELVLPSTAADVLVTSLGAFFATRSNDKELARPRRDYLADAADAEALWIDELRRRRGATITVAKEVW